MPKEYIDLTPTWTGILPSLLLVLEHGTEEGKRTARGELSKMARFADKYVEQSEFGNSDLDLKLEELCRLTSNSLFVEYYPHTREKMYKILNEYTLFAEDKIVLCPVSEGIYKALDMAITAITEKKQTFLQSK